MAHKFKPGDLVNFKGFASGDGKGGRFIVIKQLPELLTSLDLSMPQLK